MCGGDPVARNEDALANGDTGLIPAAPLKRGAVVTGDGDVIELLASVFFSSSPFLPNLKKSRFRGFPSLSLPLSPLKPTF